MTTPRIGSFIRPVGNYAYCYELVEFNYPTPEDQRLQWCFKRWGMKGKQPYNDGHHGMAYLSDLKMIASGIWKEQNCNCCMPMYYKLIASQPVQRDLFMEVA